MNPIDYIVGESFGMGIFVSYSLVGRKAGRPTVGGNSSSIERASYSCSFLVRLTSVNLQEDRNWLGVFKYF